MERSRRRCGSLLLLALAVVVLGCGGGDAVEDSPALRQRMQYLNDLSQVSWLDIEGGNVFIGFDQRPSDLAAIVNTAAGVAYKTYGKKVHVYAVQGGKPGWRPGDGPVLCEASVNLGTTGQACM